MCVLTILTANLHALRERFHQILERIRASDYAGLLLQEAEVSQQSTKISIVEATACISRALASRIQAACSQIWLRMAEKSNKNESKCALELFSIPRSTTCVLSHPARKDPVAIKVRKLIGRKIHRVYCELCGSGLFMSRNMFEPGSSDYVMHPAVDSMGVVFTATEIMRHAFEAEYAEIAFEEDSFMCLTFESRVFMAAAFFISYKLKTEDQWANGSKIASFILGKFVRETDFKSHKTHDELGQLLTYAELEILNKLKIHSLSEYNLFQIVEYKFEYLLSVGVFTPLTCCMATSVVSFYYNLFRTVTHTEFLEESAQKHGGERVALALVAVSIASILASFTVETKDLPKAYLIRFDQKCIGMAIEAVNIRIKHADSFVYGFPTLCTNNVASKAIGILEDTIKRDVTEEEKTSRDSCSTSPGTVIVS